MLIHFPIALLLIGFLAELIALVVPKPFFKQAAFAMLLIGSLGAIAAYISGSYAGAGIESGPLKAPMELHEDAALITLLLAIVTALYRVGLQIFHLERLWARIVGVLLWLALAGSVARTGYLGGQLVFRHGAGVQLALPDFSNPTVVD